jgi:hypothetical protein
VSILGGAYFISRGLAKSGTPAPYTDDDSRDDHRSGRLPGARSGLSRNACPLSSLRLVERASALAG